MRFLGWFKEKLRYLFRPVREDIADSKDDEFRLLASEAFEANGVDDLFRRCIAAKDSKEIDRITAGWEEKIKRRKESRLENLPNGRL